MRGDVAYFLFLYLRQNPPGCTLLQVDLYQIVDLARRYSSAGENGVTLFSEAFVVSKEVLSTKR
jgi:hypothetical protein